MLKRERVLSRFHTIGAPERPLGHASHPVRTAWMNVTSPTPNRKAVATAAWKRRWAWSRGLNGASISWNRYTHLACPVRHTEC